MELSDGKVRELIARLLQSRTRILCNNGFYGLLLMHLKYVLNTGCPTAYTNGEEIGFSPTFLSQLSDKELDFVMMHEILHVVLEHCSRFREGMNQERWNIACDIVVNSNILKSCDMDLDAISVRSMGGALMHLAPNGKEGHLFTMEEVYEMLKEEESKNGIPEDGGEKEDHHAKSSSQKRAGRRRGQQFDDHSKWRREGDSEDDDGLDDLWRRRAEEAAQTMRVLDPGNECGSIPAGVMRALGEWKRSKLDWRRILNEFVQEEINDYSFSPPDRRFSDTDFFLPDFNETEEFLGNILFLVDTSGSVDDKSMTQAYSEICGAIDQFGGKLSGLLGFFDSEVYDPVPFSCVDDVKKIRPRGGGGTSFKAIFSYVQQKMQEPPLSIVILTDGYAPFPEESEARGIPVLWVIQNKWEQIKPPFGKVVYL